MSLEAVLRSHFARYPSMQIQDAYKLIHQAALGSEHAITNPESARKWMESELAGRSAGPDESVVDPISDDGQIVRVHLRPFVSQGGDPDTLLDAFIRIANEFRGDIQVLKNYWNTATARQYFPSTEMDGFIESAQARNYPAEHHSLEYERLYRPAYRVVWRKYIA